MVRYTFKGREYETTQALIDTVETNCPAVVASIDSLPFGRALRIVRATLAPMIALQRMAGVKPVTHVDLLKAIGYFKRDNVRLAA